MGDPKSRQQQHSSSFLIGATYTLTCTSSLMLCIWGKVSPWIRQPMSCLVSLTWAMASRASRQRRQKLWSLWSLASSYMVDYLWLTIWFSDESMADSVRNTIQVLYTRCCRVLVLTMDGAACNVSIEKCLGCSLRVMSINPCFTLTDIDHTSTSTTYYSLPSDQVHQKQLREVWQISHAKWDHILVHST